MERTELRLPQDARDVALRKSRVKPRAESRVKPRAESRPSGHLREPAHRGGDEVASRAASTT